MYLRKNGGCRKLETNSMPVMPPPPPKSKSKQVAEELFKICTEKELTYSEFQDVVTQMARLGECRAVIR